MDLDDRELDLLAQFFAKRFPSASDRARLLVAAELEASDEPEPVAAWRDVLERAQRQGAMAGLARAARTNDPDDENLREVRRLLVGAPRRPRWSLVAAGVGMAAGLVLVAIGGVGWAMLNRPAAASHDRLEARGPTPVLADVRAPDRVRVTPAAEPVAEPVTRVTAEPDEHPVADAAQEEPPRAVALDAPPAARRPLTPDHCFRKGASVGGFWYAGDVPPGEVGDEIVVPHDVYVRAEVPSWRNDWDTRTEVQCVLYEGDRVRIKEPAVLVPADAWWVGVTGADVVVAGGERVRG